MNFGNEVADSVREMFPESTPLAPWVGGVLLLGLSKSGRILLTKYRTKDGQCLRTRAYTIFMTRKCGKLYTVKRNRLPASR